MPLTSGLRDKNVRTARENWIKREGRLPICEGCSVSCYFDPSFVLGLDDYFLLSQISKVKYLLDKHVRPWFCRPTRNAAGPGIHDIKDPKTRVMDSPPEAC
jgi:hypothetical protein